MTHILIDGYNLIRQDHELLQQERMGLEHAREGLLELMRHYKFARRHDITVVFDAWAGGHEFVTTHTEKGIHIEFSRQGQSADSHICTLLDRDGTRWTVVSSDREILDHAKRCGVAAVDSRRFLQQVRASLATPVFDKDGDATRETKIGKNMTRKKGPAKRLPKSTRRAMRRLEKL